MARARNIKPGFFRNADLVELPVETRLLFIGLWTLADREGRLEDRPKQIKIELFPADSFDVGSMLTQLQSTGFINRYEVGSLKFIEVENFIKHQDPHYKEKASEIPPPPGRENFMRATAVTRNQRLRILDRDGHACVSCGAKESLCMDHILPISRGGDSSDDNLQVLCSACNTKKGNKIDGEEKNSRKRRVNVESRLNQINDASPSDSRLLTPDSLIPDSLNPESNSLVDGADETGELDDPYDIPMPANDDERSLGVHMALVKPSAKKLPNCPYDTLVGMYHEVLPELPKAPTMMDSRKKALAKFWVWVFESRKSNGEPRATNADEALTWVRSYFERARDNEFVMANGKRTGDHKNWQSNLDYLLTEKGRVQVIEKTKEAA